MAPARSVLVFLSLSACSGGGSGDDVAPIDADLGGFDRRAMLGHLANDFAVPAHEAFATSAAALQGAIDGYCDGLGAPERAAAQTAWRDAADRWERADAVLFGPATLEMRALRDRIYSWPLVATCGIDREVPVAWGDPAAYDVTLELANVRSLAAIEYLLFVDAAEHTCAAAPTGWDALGADLAAARCTLAGLIAADVAVAADLAVDAWDGYVPELTEAGTSASTIATLREAENLVSNALFYVDSTVKDMKIGEAAGITINACGAVEAPCLREVEHRHADHATAAIRINLRALREVFTGTTETVDAAGFDDHLRAVGATDLADQMIAALDAAIVLADALPDSFLTALADQRADVVALHVALQAFTTDLKSQFLTVLGLDIPDDVAADND